MEGLDAITRRLEALLERLVALPPVPKSTYNVELVDRHVGWLLGFK